MRQQFQSVEIVTRGPGLYAFTDPVRRFVQNAGIVDGLLTCFIRHTSASLLVQENADRDVLADLEDFMRRLVSRNPDLYRHAAEGPDDMPSHIRAALTASSLSIPVRGGNPCLGTWQGLYVFDHRDAPHRREILAASDRRIIPMALMVELLTNMGYESGSRTVGINHQNRVFESA
jgi:secondary thiamine-phosphate synthase enzyme